MRLKRGVLFVLISCLGTAFAMAIPKQDDNTTSDVVGAVENKLSTNSRPVTDQRELTRPDIHFDLSAIKRTVPDNIQPSGLFQSKAWYTPPPQQPVSSLPPPPPSAPSLPFAFIGRMIDGNDVILFLSKNGRQYTVKANDLLDDTYRVDKITDNNAVLTYLPMNIQQTLVFNSTAVGSSILSASASATTMQTTHQSQIDPAP